MRRSCTSIVGIALAGLLLTSAVAVHAHPSIDVRLRDVTERIERAPSDARLFLERGELYRTHRAWDRALADYLTSRTLDPDLGVVDLCVGRMWLEAGDPGSALAPLDRFLARAPDDALAHELRARARFALERFAGAARDYSDAIRLLLAGGGKPSPETYIGRARSLVATGNDARVEALSGLEEGLSILGEPVTLALEAVEIEVAVGRTDSALARLDRLAGRAARKESWWLRSASVLERAGRLEEARRTYDRVLGAIAELPEGRRSARAVVRMEQEAREAVARLDR